VSGFYYGAVMRPAVPVLLAKSKPDKQSKSSTVKEWKGKDIELGKLKEALQSASKDCIDEGKRHKLPVFLKEYRSEDRFGNRKSLLCDDQLDSDSDDDEDTGDQLVHDVFLEGLTLELLRIFCLTEGEAELQDPPEKPNLWETHLEWLRTSVCSEWPLVPVNRLSQRGEF
jgi:hypothetical protein